MNTPTTTSQTPQSTQRFAEWLDGCKMTLKDRFASVPSPLLHQTYYVTPSTQN